MFFNRVTFKLRQVKDYFILTILLSQQIVSFQLLQTSLDGRTVHFALGGAKQLFIEMLRYHLNSERVKPRATIASRSEELIDILVRKNIMTPNWITWFAQFRIASGEDGWCR
ncbi:Hypothetical protein NTJ_05308 [Nesidiocoris tenuis]|uniref:Uncharacterized protein n=1 Tax=Nesidiocoris tenuis TaxID=355587 RepID=A0ABN7AJS6_9HEMI|nr:Hypothetical protein NTJ_05308 [Nesidiocoris tenuis]